MYKPPLRIRREHWAAIWDIIVAKAQLLQIKYSQLSATHLNSDSLCRGQRQGSVPEVRWSNFNGRVNILSKQILPMLHITPKNAWHLANFYPKLYKIQLGVWKKNEITTAQHRQNRYTRTVNIICKICPTISITDQWHQLITNSIHHTGNFLIWHDQFLIYHHRLAKSH